MPCDLNCGPLLFSTKDGIIAVAKLNYAFFNVFFDILKWEVARLIWIGFYKNNDNDKCFIGQLPKAIITNYIFELLGNVLSSLKKTSLGRPFVEIK